MPKNDGSPHKYEILMNRMRSNGETFTEEEARAQGLCCRLGGMLDSIRDNLREGDELYRTTEPSNGRKSTYRWGIRSNAFDLKLTEDQISALIDGGWVLVQVPVRLSIAGLGAL